MGSILASQPHIASQLQHVCLESRCACGSMLGDRAPLGHISLMRDPLRSI